MALAMFYNHNKICADHRVPVLSRPFSSESAPSTIVEFPGIRECDSKGGEDELKMSREQTDPPLCESERWAKISISDKNRLKYSEPNYRM